MNKDMAKAMVGRFKKAQMRSAYGPCVHRWGEWADLGTVNEKLSGLGRVRTCQLCHMVEGFLA